MPQVRGAEAVQLVVGHDAHILAAERGVAGAELGLADAGVGHELEGSVIIQAAEEERVDGGLAEGHEDVGGFAVFEAGGAVFEYLPVLGALGVVERLLRGGHDAVLDAARLRREVTEDLVLFAT